MNGLASSPRLRTASCCATSFTTPKSACIRPTLPGAAIHSRPTPAWPQYGAAGGKASISTELPKKSSQGILPLADAKALLLGSCDLLRSCFWPVIVVYAIKDAAAFVLHRIGHRLTNHVAEVALGTPISSMTNPWWLFLDSHFLDGNLGYQAIIAMVFLLCLPINILFNSYALATVVQVLKRRTGNAAATVPTVLPEEASVSAAAAGSSSAAAQTAAAAASSTLQSTGREQQGAAGSSASPSSIEDSRGRLSEAGASDASPSHPTTTAAEAAAAAAGGGSQAGSSASAGEAAGTAAGGSSTLAEQSVTQSATQPSVQPASKGWLHSMRMALAEARAVGPEVWGMLKDVWWVDMMFNMRALPLQALSLLVLPMFWTLPRLLSIQVAVPAAIAEGLKGQAALDRSTQLMEGLRRAYAWPYLSLILGIRFLDLVRTMMLAAMPARYWTEVMEVPYLLIAMFGFAKLVVIRLQDLMPVAAYQMAANRPASMADESGNLDKSMQEGPPSATGTILSPQPPSL